MNDCNCKCGKCGCLNQNRRWCHCDKNKINTTENKDCGCTGKIDQFAGNTVVIDDANETVYLYGNVYHENYHNASTVCSPFVALPADVLTFTRNDYPQHREVFDGVQSDDSITLSHTPDTSWPVLVFKNGLKQVEGDSRDYTLSGKELQFKFEQLEASDVVEVYYRYFNKEA